MIVIMLLSLPNIIEGCEDLMTDTLRSENFKTERAGKYTEDYIKQ